MPLAFKDEPVKKGKNEKDLELFSGPRKGFPMHLEGQVLPELIKKVGDVKSGRVSMARVDEYLIRNTLLFDRDLLKKMFDEADYKKEGSLDHRTMAMALTGRFPKWQFMKEWRRLVAMILDLTDLILSEDHVNVQLFEGEAKTFNSDSFWSDELPALPPVPKRVWARRRRGTAAASSPSRDGTSAAESTSASPPDPSSPARQHGSSSAFGATGLPSLGDSALRTAGGLKATGQIGAEVAINRTLESQLARSTFESAREFKDFSTGLELSSKLSALDASIVARGPQGLGTGTGASLSTAALPKGVRAWNATLPPAAVYLPAPALQTLRNSIRSVTSTQADFVTMHRPLDTSALDQKKVLGEQLDVKASLARVEPVREPRVLYNADYVSAQDYGAHCRTAPSRWYNEYYPAAEGQERPPPGGGMGSTYLRACPY